MPLLLVDEKSLVVEPSPGIGTTTALAIVALSTVKTDQLFTQVLWVSYTYEAAKQVHKKLVDLAQFSAITVALSGADGGKKITNCKL